MADTITRAIDIEVNIIHADKAKRDLRDVADATEKTTTGAHKLLKELLAAAGGLAGVAKAAAAAGAKLIPLEVVEDVARWFQKATVAVKDFEAKSTQAGKSAKATAAGFDSVKDAAQSAGEGAAEAADDFQRVKEELDRLLDVQERARAEGRPNLFTHELAKSIDWLMPKMRDCGAELGGLEGKYLGVAVAINRNAAAARKIAGVTEDVGAKTKKTGGAMGFAQSKAVKFFGAIGLGVYSMYSLANAVRRGARAVIDFVKGGIDLAVKAHKEWQVVISSSKKKLGELQKELGEKLLPQIGAVNVAQRELMETLGDTGAVDSAARGIGTLALAWAGVLYAINECIKAGKTALDQVEEWGKKQGVPVGKIIRAGFAVGTLGLSEAVGPLVGKYAKLGKRSEAQAEAEAEAERARGLIGPRPPVKPWGYDREKEKPTGGRAPKRQEYLPSVEKGIAGVDILPPEELAAAESELAMAAVRERHEEEREAKREAKRKKEAEVEAARLAKLKTQAEEIAQLIDPTSYLIAGFKSGEMDKAIAEFATNLGETVARELMSKLIMMGVMAILDALTGGIGGGATRVMKDIKFGQHGMYTGEYEGPVFVHKHEVIQPLDTYSQMSKLLSKAQPGIAPAAAGAGGGGGVTLSVSDTAREFFDFNLARRGKAGTEILSEAEGA